MQSTAPQQYFEERILYASASDLVMMLYEAAIENLQRAELAAMKDSRREWNFLIGKTTEIIAHLLGALRPEEYPELAANLRSVYLFAQSELAVASCDAAGAGKIRGVRDLLVTLADGWKGVVLQLSGQMRLLQPNEATPGPRPVSQGLSVWTA